MYFSVEMMNVIYVFSEWFRQSTRMKQYTLSVAIYFVISSIES